MILRADLPSGPGADMLLATIDFHVTSECSQKCPYCWGPRDYVNPIDTPTALRIVTHIKDVGARRIVFTGGDPLLRSDICGLVQHAKKIGLEVALSTTGDQITKAFLDEAGPSVDLISLPLDGSSEEISARTKEPGHFLVVMAVLELLRRYQWIDLKVCTPVTRYNLADVPRIRQLVEEYAGRTRARVFYNVFQTFPRAMCPVDWNSLVVTRPEFTSLKRQLGEMSPLRTNVLDHKTLDRLYVLVFPDGSLVFPSGSTFRNLGRFVDLTTEELATMLRAAQFDSVKHLRYSRGWEKGFAGQWKMEGVDGRNEHGFFCP